MKPLDPRLLKYARSSRAFLAIGAILGLLQGGALIGIAWSIARCVTQAIEGHGFDTLGPDFALLLVAVVVRGVTQWGMDWAGARAAATAKSELRGALMRKIAQTRGNSIAVPGASETEPDKRLGSAELTLLATHLLDALDSYFGKYLPQLLLTMIVMPLLILVTLIADPVSGITEIVVLPIIPLFMILIGWATQRAQAKQLDALSTLAASFLEIIEGLSTLKIFGRARRQRDRIRTITDDYRKSTMKVLRVTFLSGFALELFASLSVALVAVQIGIRLIDNEMALFAGLFALILAPEVFAPLRAVGAQFHAASEGVQASATVFAILDAPDVATGSAPKGAERDANATGAATVLEVGAAAVQYDNRVVLDRVSATFAAGRITALTGESGAGKSTLLGFIRGEVEGTGNCTISTATGSRACHRDDIAWMGQSAGLIEGTVFDNVALGQPDASLEQVRAALSLAGFATANPQQSLGVGGAGLSGGQAQRVALARAIVRARAKDCPVVLLDEPTSALDADREREVISALRVLADEGRIVVVVSHRPAVIAAADATVTLTAPVHPVAAAASEGAHA